jgi:Asp-tRNA(Asn)/Glu-tRNA(Gln) amidotransferase A subunit family amidase
MMVRDGNPGFGKPRYRHLEGPPGFQRGVLPADGPQQGECARGGAIARRQSNRKVHARLAERYDAAISLATPGAAPVGLGSTGDPVFNVPASMLGIPALSLPILSAESLPLGLQIMGFAGQDAGLFAIGAAVRDLLGAMPSPARAA